MAITYTQEFWLDKPLQKVVVEYQWIGYYKTELVIQDAYYVLSGRRYTFTDADDQRWTDYLYDFRLAEDQHDYEMDYWRE